MPTTNQLVRKGRKRRNKKGHKFRKPVRKATVIRAFVEKPRKPNSGKRKLARVRFSDNGALATVLFPGEGYHVREHDTVLVRGGKTVPDLPGVKWEIVRGALDAPGVEGRKQSRSKYGTRK